MVPNETCSSEEKPHGLCCDIHILVSGVACWSLVMYLGPHNGPLLFYIEKPAGAKLPGSIV